MRESHYTQYEGKVKAGIKRDGTKVISRASVKYSIQHGESGDGTNTKIIHLRMLGYTNGMNNGQPWQRFIMLPIKRNGDNRIMRVYY